MTCVSWAVRRYLKSIFFSAAQPAGVPLLSPDTTRLCEPRQNSSLMVRLWLDTRVVFSNEPVGDSALITRITSTGKRLSARMGWLLFLRLALRLHVRLFVTGMHSNWPVWISRIKKRKTRECLNSEQLYTFNKHVARVGKLKSYIPNAIRSRNRD